jgi:signal transduction histidine kinase
MKKRIALALRHKITIVFVLLLVAGLSFSFLVYERQISIIQDRLRFIENADDIQKHILEARRYEKNFFLYGGSENLNELQYYLRQTSEQLTRFTPEAKPRTVAQKLNHVKDLLAEYNVAIAKYDAATKSATSGEEPEKYSFLADQVRQIGKNLTEQIANIVNQERRYVDNLLSYQKKFFLNALAVYLILVCSAAYYLFLRVVLPLSRIEKAAADITLGSLHRIPPIGGSSEIHSLVDAINRMISELDKKSEQLMQKEKMASLGTLTSGVAHELNNPLSNIYSSTQILLEELDQNELAFQKKMLEGIEEQVEKARGIVKSLLEFARESEFKPVTINVRQLIDNSIKLLHNEIPANVGIEVETEDNLSVQVDPRRLSQALINLVLNGIQAMEGTSGQLTLHARSGKDKRSVIIEVADAGCGISKENLHRIFDPFFSTKDVDRGTGLGLYVTYGIIKKHNGNLSVTSEPGVGTTFTVTLPIEKTSEL